MIDRDLPLKKEIANNIKTLMKLNGIKNQIKLSEISGISKSTLSDYLRLKTLINPGNVEKLASAFNVDKSDIDPSFASPNRSNQTVTIAAHIDEDLTEEEMEEVRKYIEFIKSQRE
ncbi:helix-turn-helix domain-containing protein [Sporosarcina psychrophila]|uniref:Transcriptional regulator with XRE-family HTH domain n=1 Tax=Sporosarcina psychrophila TaxID=1476 RepID=A0ABV2KAL3_SPOPS